MIAGDDNRAAFAFIGTPTAGNDQQGGSGSGVAARTSSPASGTSTSRPPTTAGKTWKTVDATPTDPVQRGCVWLAGGSSTCRNLLDFNDITIDRTGRILIGWADGCTGDCVTTAAAAGPRPTTARRNAPATGPSTGTVTRQVTGLTLFKAFDVPEGTDPVVPEAPVAVLLPLAALAVLAGAAVVRRRRLA